jgi:hypothetical protein
MSSTLQRRSPSDAGLETDPRTFHAAADVICTRQDDAMVLLDLRRGTYYTLNELGWRIWEQVSAGVSLADVVRILRQAYDVPADTFGSDVATFVEQLQRAALVEPAER